MAVAGTLLGYIEQHDLRVMRRLHRWRAPRPIRVVMLMMSRLGDGWLHGGGDPADLPGLLERLARFRAEEGTEGRPFEVHVISADAYTLDGVRRLQDQGVKMDRYLEYTNTSLDVLKAEQRPQAVQKVRLELALETVAEREGLTVSDAEVGEAVQNALAEEDHAGHRHGDLGTADPVRAYFRHQLLMRKTIDYLSAMAAPESSDTMESPAPTTELQEAGTSASRKERPVRGKKER